MADKVTLSPKVCGASNFINNAITAKLKAKL